MGKPKPNSNPKGLGLSPEQSSFSVSERSSSLNLNSHSIKRDKNPTSLIRSTLRHQPVHRSNSKTKTKSAPSLSQPYKLRDVTKELIGDEGILQLHVTRSAPTAKEMHDKVARAHEKERIRYFGVPIKMYDDIDTQRQLINNNAELSEEDRNELQLYGSRVIMNKEGRVIGLEVRGDLDVGGHEHKKKHTKAVHCCQCLPFDYDVSELLEESQHARRALMAKILVIEAILRLPSFLFLYYQYAIAPLHDFIYVQNAFMILTFCLVLGTRIVTLSCSNIGRYEPCRSILILVIMAGHCVIGAFMTSLLEKYIVYYVDYNDYPDPISLSALKKKKMKIIYNDKGVSVRPNVPYPFVVPLVVLELLILYFSLALILITQKKVMNEMKNGFILVILTYLPILLFGGYKIVEHMNKRKYTDYEFQTLDYCQMLFAIIYSTKWTMWRFYELQRILQGRVMNVDESMYLLISLSFAL